MTGDDTLPSVAVNVSHSFSRADGCAGSAIKGIKVIPIRSQPSSSSAATSTSKTPSSSSSVIDAEHANSKKGEQRGTAMGDMRIVSVGYDQRLSLWRPLDNSSTSTTTSTSVTLKVKQQSPCVDDDDDDDGNIGDDDTDSGSDSDVPQKSTLCPDAAEIMQKRDGLLEWVGGIAVHIGDVCALDVLVVSEVRPPHTGTPFEDIINDLQPASITSQVAHEVTPNTIDIVVVGEGFQLLTGAI